MAVDILIHREELFEIIKDLADDLAKSIQKHHNGTELKNFNYTNPITKTNKHIKLFAVLPTDSKELKQFKLIHNVLVLARYHLEDFVHYIDSNISSITKLILALPSLSTTIQSILTEQQLITTTLIPQDQSEDFIKEATGEISYMNFSEIRNKAFVSDIFLSFERALRKLDNIRDSAILELNGSVLSKIPNSRIDSLNKTIDEKLFQPLLHKSFSSIIPHSSDEVYTKLSIFLKSILGERYVKSNQQEIDAESDLNLHTLVSYLQTIFKKLGKYHAIMESEQKTPIDKIKALGCLNEALGIAQTLNQEYIIKIFNIEQYELEKSHLVDELKEITTSIITHFPQKLLMLREKIDSKPNISEMEYVEYKRQLDDLYQEANTIQSYQTNLFLKELGVIGEDQIIKAQEFANDLGKLNTSLLAKHKDTIDIFFDKTKELCELIKLQDELLQEDQAAKKTLFTQIGETNIQLEIKAGRLKSLQEEVKQLDSKIKKLSQEQKSLGSDLALYKKVTIENAQNKLTQFVSNTTMKKSSSISRLMEQNKLTLEALTSEFGEKSKELRELELEVNSVKERQESKRQTLSPIEKHARSIITSKALLLEDLKAHLETADAKLFADTQMSRVGKKKVKSIMGYLREQSETNETIKSQAKQFITQLQAQTKLVKNVDRTLNELDEELLELEQNWMDNILYFKKGSTIAEIKEQLSRLQGRITDFLNTELIPMEEVQESENKRRKHSLKLFSNQALSCNVSDKALSINDEVAAIKQRALKFQHQLKLHETVIKNIEDLEDYLNQRHRNHAIFDFFQGIICKIFGRKTDLQTKQEFVRDVEVSLWKIVEENASSIKVTTSHQLTLFSGVERFVKGSWSTAGDTELHRVINAVRRSLFEAATAVSNDESPMLEMNDEVVLVEVVTEGAVSSNHESTQGEVFNGVY